jgi:hypothetical protein
MFLIYQQNLLSDKKLWQKHQVSISQIINLANQRQPRKVAQRIQILPHLVATDAKSVTVVKEIK